MAAITNLSDLVSRITGGSSGTPEQIFFQKQPLVDGAAPATPSVTRFTSLWQYVGMPCSHGTVPTTVAVPDNTTPGGLLQADPGGSRQKWLIGAGASIRGNGILVLYDRLLHIGSLDGTSASAQTVGGAITRYTNGIGNQIWIEIYTAIGTTSRDVTAIYTDQDNGASTTVATTIGTVGTYEAQRILPLPLAIGDRGVKNVTSVTLSGSTGTVGNFGVTVAHPLMIIPCYESGTGTITDLISQLPAIQEILPDACLALAFMPFTAIAPDVYGFISSVEA